MSYQDSKEIKIRDLLSKWANMGKIKSNKYSVCYSYANNIFHCEYIYFDGENIWEEEKLYKSQNKSVIFLSDILDGAVNHIVLFQVFEEIMSDVGISFEKIVDIRKNFVVYQNSGSKISDLYDIIDNDEENNKKDAL